MPIVVSSMAKRGIEMFSGMKPKVRQLIVSPARHSAELVPGKNFSTPNQKKIIPRVILKEEIPNRAKKLVKKMSSFSYLSLSITQT